MDSQVVPRLAPGLELYGEYEGSGFAEPQYVARRADGQVLQLSRLLHLVTSEIDGHNDLSQIADRVSRSFGRGVSADNVAYLVQEKLAPMGVVERADGADSRLPHSDLLTSLKFRGTLLPVPAVAVLARALAWLHLPVVVVPVLLSVLAVDVWLFTVHGGITPLLAVLREPLLILVLVVLSWLALIFHELGHASACHYSGARPGVIGYGLFIIWPALYTDVTDVYRIGRAGRLRTDLGGVYFHVVFMLVLATAYAVTGHAVFLAALFLIHFDILDQLLPIVRFDGYFILGDLVGVPDLFGKVTPILKSMLPGRPVDPRVAMLRTSTRRLVTTWVLTVVPLLTAMLAYSVYNLPLILRTAATSVQNKRDEAAAAFGAGDWISGVLAAGSAFLVCLPTIGLLYILYGIARRLVQAAQRRVGKHPRKVLALHPRRPARPRCCRRRIPHGHVVRVPTAPPSARHTPIHPKGDPRCTSTPGPDAPSSADRSRSASPSPSFR